MKEPASPRIRLVDAHDYIIIDGSTSDRHLALSYVWGEARQLTLDKQNYENLATPDGLRHKDLPRSIADAIKITQRIYDRYLWVYRLCILSDDQRNLLEQLPIMNEICACASLTIIGASLCSANDLLPGVEPNSRPKLQRSEVVKGIRYLTGQPTPRSAVHVSKWSTRGWTFQEEFLSPRCLIFSPYQVYFQCMVGSVCEDTCGDGPRKESPRHAYLDKVEGTKGYRCLFYHYAVAASEFFQRQFTIESDALWAFNGVAEDFESQSCAGFVWGLTVQNLDAALLWVPCHGLSSLEKRAGEHRV